MCMENKMLEDIRNKAALEIYEKNKNYILNSVF